MTYSARYAHTSKGLTMTRVRPAQEGIPRFVQDPSRMVIAAYDPASGELLAEVTVPRARANEALLSMKAEWSGAECQNEPAWVRA